MNKIIGLLVLFVLFSGVVYAGVLTGTRSVGPEGTTFTLYYRQGCNEPGRGTLGPNQCHATKPLHCPIDSVGSTSFLHNCSFCGCDMHYNCSALGTVCDACDDPCDDACESYETCTVIGDWCDNIPNCACAIFTEAQGCAEFLPSCPSGQTCKYTGGASGDRCDSNNYECQGSDPCRCRCPPTTVDPDCSNRYVCRYTPDSGSGTCSPSQNSVSCKIMVAVSWSSGNYLICGITSGERNNCESAPGGCSLDDVTTCSSSPTGDCCTADEYLSGACPWP
ncbi:MAG: hypothetical protein ACMXYL_02140 [Candidatus Woesearchaeota archaeon]